MPTLIERITLGCKTSPFSGGIQDVTVIPLGSEICLSLWPFIRELPRNIAMVRDSLPKNMDAGKKLFSQLADRYVFTDERMLTVLKMIHRVIGPRALVAP